jgi:hypothetical protein
MTIHIMYSFIFILKNPYILYYCRNESLWLILPDLSIKYCIVIINTYFPEKINP